MTDGSAVQPQLHFPHWVVDLGPDLSPCSANYIQEVRLTPSSIISHVMSGHIAPSGRGLDFVRSGMPRRQTYT